MTEQSVHEGYHYLASPYSHKAPIVMQRRYKEAMHATAWLLRHKIWVYAPIVHCHEMAQAFKLPTDAAFWTDYNRVMQGNAQGTIFLDIEGANKSLGMADEWNFAKHLKHTTMRMVGTPGGSYDLIWVMASPSQWPEPAGAAPCP